MTEFLPIGGLGPQIDEAASAETEPPSEPISLGEHENIGPFPVSQADAEFLEGMEERFETAPLDVSFGSDGQVTLSSGSFVGVLTLPSGVRVEVTPKRTVTRLLWALRYAFDTPVDSFDLETDFTSASSFFDAIGILFRAELHSVLSQGLHRDYVPTSSIEQRVKGRIDVQRQLQRPSPVTTDFAVDYEEFTADNTLNQAVLAALRVLITLVSDDELTGQLRAQEQQLREFASVEPVQPAVVRRIELSRLNDHYATLLELATLVLEREFFEDIRAGSQRSLALFVNMNTVFERIVERAFRALAQDRADLRVDGQASIPNLVNGPHSVSMRPDVLVRTTDGRPVLVADAKWKTSHDSPSSSDVYQLTSYILSLEVPGVLVYPGGSVEIPPSTVDGHSLHSFAVPTDSDASSYDDYVQDLEGSVNRLFEQVIAESSDPYR
ncbi:McrC family protein [Halomicrobium salinisoli]|uniref:McrC family protein n=1 Tax=Halomicrobium salinisoli TaxID=2878391 RepID=UPI001CEFFD6A|nr:McrC family protein [Halomicrobium salinisoli]